MGGVGVANDEESEKVNERSQRISEILEKNI